MTASTFEHDGAYGRIFVRRWSGDAAARFIALIAHGYGEHSGRYEHVADALAALGAAVYAPDHYAHGNSEGEKVSFADFEPIVSDLHAVSETARGEQGDLSVVLLGHSMGGLIAIRYAQRYGAELAALVLSGPAVGIGDVVDALLPLDEIPDIPIDPAVLSRDPAVGEAYAADPLVYHGPFRRETLQAFSKAMADAAAAGSLGPLPTLWIHGEEDQLVPYAPTAEAMKVIAGSNLQHKPYEGAAHEVFNEVNKAEVLADVETFLATILDL